MHKVFVSFHHANDQKYKEGLVSCGKSSVSCPLKPSDSAPLC